MAKNTMTMFKGIGTGMAAGIMVGIAGTLMMRDTGKNKKTLNKAFQAIEGMLDRLQCALS